MSSRNRIFQDYFDQNTPKKLPKSFFRTYFLRFLIIRKIFLSLTLFLFTMAKIIPNEIKNNHFKPINSSEIPENHCKLLSLNGLDLAKSDYIVESHLIKIGNTSTNKIIIDVLLESRF